MNLPTVSIIIVTYNSEGYTDNCLKSILKVSYPNIEIVIFDNNSQNKNYLSKFKSKTKLVLSDINLGYSEGNNQALKHSSGKYIFILNPDTQVDINFLEPLVKVMEQDSKIAACQPSVFLLEDKKTLNLTGKVTHFLGFDWIRDYKNRTLPNDGYLISFSGSGVLLRRSTIEKINLFDQIYFMYYEDSDLSWRIRLSGYKIYYVGKSIIYHDYKYIPVEGYQSLKQKLYYAERNRLLTIFKNYSLKSLFLLLPMIIFLEIGLIFMAFFQHWFILKIKIYWELFFLIPHITNWRKNITMIRKLDDADLVSGFVSQITFEKYNIFIVKNFINPILDLYWKLILRFI